MIARFIATALATALAAWLIPGITLDGTTDTQEILTLAAVAVIIGLVNTFVKPVVTVLTGCLVLLTLGLFLLVINALMLMLTSWISGKVGLGFHVDGFWPAFWGGLVISLVSSAIYGIIGRDKDDKRREARR
ncbi:phage holin family protein [Blastococcus sp. Marseille-P5729]|uniref:phage holin family protein n=1 Tax=Blastococcus sp. Marseille-P5729 TaxID=2086582 RepID=UPI000D0F98DD|nr:phage holin family protein [Blastococcus sp. Marseille-P5729]